MDETATVKIFLVHGDPDSLRTAEISNWAGKAVAGPRSKLDLVLERVEANKSGIYFLTGINPDTGKDRVYIGEAEAIKKRVRKHLDKEFWKTIVFFVSKDENLTKAHIKYLEGKLIDKAKLADRFELENSQSSGSHLPESDTADMNVFLAKIEQLLPIMGQTFLKTRASKAKIAKSDQLYCAIKNVTATGEQTEDGFMVFKESEAVLDDRPSAKNYPHRLVVRKQLIDDGILHQIDGKLVFTKDYEFSSPSAAASVIHGGHANGLTAWKDSDGNSLKEREASELSD